MPPRKRTKQEQIEAGYEVKRLMAHPLMVEFFETAEHQLFLRFKGAEYDQDVIRDIKLQQMALDAFRQFVQRLLIDADRAEKELNNA